MRLSGIQIFRIIEQAGGLWAKGDLVYICGSGYKRQVEKWFREADFPHPVFIRQWRGDKLRRFWTGEEVLDWLEAHEKWGAAERLSEHVNRTRLIMRAYASQSRGDTLVGVDGKGKEGEGDDGN